VIWFLTVFFASISYSREVRIPYFLPLSITGEELKREMSGIIHFCSL
jgi:hypothetical protein